MDFFSWFPNHSNKKNVFIIIFRRCGVIIIISLDEWANGTNEKRRKKKNETKHD